jgi:uncharacterized protein with PQ loop repeat
MNWADFFGMAAIFTSFAMTLVGFPAQILENYRRKSTQGLSLVLYIMMLANYSVWLSYGFLKPIPDWVLIVANIPGVLCIFISLIQFWIYRRKHLSL